jgi:hypothetical protein
MGHFLPGALIVNMGGFKQQDSRGKMDIVFHPFAPPLPGCSAADNFFYKRKHASPLWCQLSVLATASPDRGSGPQGYFLPIMREILTANNNFACL